MKLSKFNAGAAAAAVFLLAAGSIPMGRHGAAHAQTPTAGDGAKGKAILTSQCASCHDLSVVSAEGRTPQGWSQIVDRMVNMGATLSDDDVTTLTAYLSKTYPAAPG